VKSAAYLFFVVAVIFSGAPMPVLVGAALAAVVLFFWK
jgi:hypothetical protein